MKKVFLALLTLTVYSCGNGPMNDAGQKQVEIKYPLPSTKDSLVALLKILPADTNRVNVLIMLSWRLLGSQPDTSLILNNEAFALAEKQSVSPNPVIAKCGKKGMANSYGNLGVYFYMKDDYERAIGNYQKELKLDEEIGKKAGIARSLGNIGNVFRIKGEYPKAIEFYLRSLKTNEESKNKLGISNDLGNIGVVYKLQGDYVRALDYYNRALKMDESFKNDAGVARHLGNIGNVYYLQKNYPEAMEYLSRSMYLNKAIGNKNGMAINLGTIASVNGDFAKSRKDDTERDSLFSVAIAQYLQAIKLEKELNNRNLVATWMGNIGALYTAKGEYANAFEFLYRALVLEDSIGVKDPLKECYQSLSLLYEKSTLPLPDSVGGKMLNMEQMRQRSLHYFKSYVNLRDTIFSEENKKQLVRKEMSYEFEKKEIAAKAEQERRDAITRIVIVSVSAGFVLVLVLAVFIFRSYRQKQKANAIISEQKRLVEEKQKDILDSISYAKRIQQSLLPSEKYIRKSLKGKSMG